jgi:hypothetical protein
MAYYDTVFSRNLFLDSQANESVDNTSFSIYLPPIDFQCKGDEEMRLVLTSFNMTTNFYNINPTNSIFYVYNPAGAGSYTQVIIPNQNYYDFVDSTINGQAVKGLATGIQEGLITAGYTGSTCTYSYNTGKFTINLGSAPTGAYIVCFEVSPSSGISPPTGVNSVGFYNDSAQVLGAYPTRGSALRNAFGSAVAGSPMISPYVGNLGTLEAVYLTTNLQSLNYATYNFIGTGQANAIINSPIFARIPLPTDIHSTQDPFITFQDTNNVYTIIIGNKQLDQLTVSLVDAKGRFITQVAPGQCVDNQLSFQISLRYEVIKKIEVSKWIVNPMNLLHPAKIPLNP